MFRQTIVAGIVAGFLGVGTARAGPPLLDLIPRDAAGAVVIRNLAGFQKKTDKLLKAVQPNFPVGAAQVFAMYYQFLGIQGGLDEDNSAAAVLANPKAAGIKGDVSQATERLVVWVLPFSDRDKMAANFGFKAGALLPDRLAKAKATPLRKPGFCYVHGKHLFLGVDDKAVLSVAQGKSLGADLAGARRRSLNEADLLAHAAPLAWGAEWQKALKNLEAGFDIFADKEEQKVIRLFVQALGEVQHGFLAVRLDDGLGVSGLAVFPKNDDGPARKFLKLLAGGPRSSRLDGLPEGNLLGALAVSGDLTKNPQFATVFLTYLLRNTPQSAKVIAPADRLGFVGVFTEIWLRLQGSRLAVYQNEAERKHGIFGVLAILDTAHPDQFIADMRQLAHIADGKALDLKTKAGREIDGPKIEALIRDLGDRRFRVRHSATTKLRLLGEASLPYLDKAAKSSDLEASLRAKRLKDEILQANAQRRKDLLAKGVPLFAKPRFAFHPRAETRSGCRVDVVTVQLAGKDAAAIPQYKQLFGPDWEKLRLAVQGNHVVALLGSDVRLLDAVLANLKAGKPGLAASPALAAFQRQGHPSRKVEVHISLQRVLSLAMGRSIQPSARAQAGQLLSSASLTLEKDHVQVDYRLSTADLKAAVKQNP
jgi:hypothetical protein